MWGCEVTGKDVRIMGEDVRLWVIDGDFTYAAAVWSSAIVKTPL